MLLKIGPNITYQKFNVEPLASNPTNQIRSGGCETLTKNKSKPCENQRDEMKSHRFRDLAPKTGMEKDYIPIVFLYVWVCLFIHSLLCHSPLESSARYMAI
jgi:hypothetical protein